MLKKIILGRKWPLITILLIAGLILSYNINKPFWGHHDWNGVYWGEVAKNFARNGPFATKFAMDLGRGNLNFHFFPTFTLIWALFFRIFDVANWVSRLFAIVFSLGSITIFYKIIKKFFDTKTAVMACLLWIVTPMFIYFGKMPVHEIPLMFFVLLAFWFYLNKKFWPLFFAILTAELITWPGFFLVPAITIHAIFTKSFNKKYLIFWFSSIFVFCSHLLHDYLVTGDFFGGGLREIFFSRIGAVSLVPYLLTLIRWSWTYFFLLVPLSILGLILTRNKIAILFFFYAIIYPIVFRDASFRHDYLLIYFWPFLALSSALVLKRYLLVFLVIAIMLVFRWKFILALENSDIYRESVRFGQFIHDNSTTTEKITVITADPTVPWDGWFINYYADRVIVDRDGEKIFSYLPGGRMIIGAEINNNGTK